MKTTCFQSLTHNFLKKWWIMKDFCCFFQKPKLPHIEKKNSFENYGNTEKKEEKIPQIKQKKTLILDLDETLVHGSLQPENESSRFIMEVKIQTNI